MTEKNTKKAKKALIWRVIGAFRDANNQDGAFEEVAARRLEISPADLRCLNVIQNLSHDPTAGELAKELAVTTGAVTGTLDRLEAAGYAERRVDPADRRRIRLAVSPLFYERAETIWAPLALDWQRSLGARFTAAELATIIDFLELSVETGAKHLDRLAGEAEGRH
jgi:DNA-binding MarR family transcriptional regulator